jgi:hypothetical protein
MYLQFFSQYINVFPELSEILKCVFSKNVFLSVSQGLKCIRVDHSEVSKM